MNSNQVPLFILIFIGIVFVIFLFTRNAVEYDESPKQIKNTDSQSYDTITVKIGNKEVSAELADTPAKQTKGLMFREYMAENAGMLFVFSGSSIRSFWMANTKIPLDMIWADENKKIVYIHKDVPPCTETGKLQAYCTTYSPDSPAKYVLEVNGGWAEKNDVNVGDTLQIIK